MVFDRTQGILKNIHTSYNIFSCEHVYLYFHTAVRWLQWLYIAKWRQLEQHMCRYLSREVCSCFSSCQNQHFISSLQYYNAQLFSCFRRNHSACTSSLLSYSNKKLWVIEYFVRDLFHSLFTAAAYNFHVIFCSTRN